MRQSKYKNIFFFFMALTVILVFGILVVGQINDLDYVRFDKYPISTDIKRYLMAIITFLLTLIIVKRFSIGKNIIFLPTTVFIFLFFVLIYPGVVVTSPDEGLAFYGYSLSILGFSFGVMITSFVFKFNTNLEIDNMYFNRKLIKKLDHAQLVWIISVSLIGLALVLVVLGLNSSGSLSGILSFLLDGNVPEESSGVREARLSLYGTGVNYFEIIAKYFLLLILPIMSLTLILNGVLHNDKKSKLIGYIILMFIILGDIGTGQRRLLGYLIIYFIICFSLVKRIRLSKILKPFLFVFAVYILQTITLGRMQGQSGSFFINIVMSINRVIERIFLTKGYVSTIVFDYFPEHSNFRYGSTILQKLSGSFSNDTPLAVEMHYYINGAVGTAGPQAFGEGYVNFGFIGMVVFSIIIGVIVQIVSILVVRKKLNDSSSLAIFSFLPLLFGLIGYSEFMVFKSNGLHILIFYGLIQLLFVGLLRQYYKSKKGFNW